MGREIYVAILSCKMCTSPYTVWHFVEFESDIGSDRLAKSKPVLWPFDDFSQNEDLRVTFDCILMGQQKSSHAVAWVLGGSKQPSTVNNGPTTANCTDRTAPKKAPQRSTLQRLLEILLIYRQNPSSKACLGNLPPEPLKQSLFGEFFR